MSLVAGDATLLAQRAMEKLGRIELTGDIIQGSFACLDRLIVTGQTQLLVL